MKKEIKKKEYILEYDMVFANVLSFILLVGAIAITGLIVAIRGEIIDIKMNSSSMISFSIFYILMIFWMILHEIIHNIAYQVMGAKRENIVFGAAIEKGVFYCKCKEYINKKCIMTSLLAPFILIGVITYILGFIIDSPLLIALSVINISGASGDLMMFSFFLKQDDDVEFKELGFSSPFVLRTSKDLISKKYMGIKSIREVKDKKEIEEGPEKKLTISKASWVFIIVMVVLLGIIVALQMYIDKTSDEYNKKISEENLRKINELTKNQVSNMIFEDGYYIIEEYQDSFLMLKNASLTLVKNSEEKKISSGYIFLVYKADLNGDNIPEICSAVSYGSGLIDYHIDVYDYVSDKIYSLWDRGEYDYLLFCKDDTLQVIKTNWGIGSSNHLTTYAVKGALKLVIDENHSDGGYLTIENEETL